MDTIDTSGRALVEFWKYAVKKGLMKSNTGNALRAACTQVLAVEDGWEKLDVRAMNIDDIFRRFQNKKGTDYSPASLGAYRRRFEQGVRDFLRYSEDPQHWKPSASERNTRSGKRAGVPATNGEQSGETNVERPAPAAPIRTSGLVEYPFPLGEGRFAYLKLPADLKQSEVKRLSIYLQALALDGAAA